MREFVKRMPAKKSPTRRPPREIPEVDFTKVRPVLRGKYFAKVRRAFAVVIVERDLFARFGSSQAINAALRALVEAVDAVRPPPKTKGSSRSSKRTAA